MDYLKEFKRMMKDQREMALATSVNDHPNVRIVNFIYDAEQKGVLYFSTFKNNPKTKEFIKNDKLAFTTIPHGNEEHIRVQNAIVRKSDATVYDLKEAFIQKIPDYEMMINEMGPQLVLYEIHFKKATVTLDYMQIGNVTL